MRGAERTRVLTAGPKYVGNDRMNDIDLILGRVRAAPLPSELANLDDAVLGALASRPASGTVVRSIGMAAAAALAVGIIGGIPAGKDQAVAAVAPLGAPSPLAPSSLLVGDR